MLKKTLTLGIVVIFTFGGYTLNAQKKGVGIGTANPDPSALLDLTSNQGGLLLPRMKKVERNAILKPATGLIIFQTDENSGFYYFTGKEWSTISKSEVNSIAAANPDNWSLTGNAGSSSSANFLGTTDNVPLTFKVNNIQSGYLNSNGNTYLGYQSGLNRANGYNNVGIGLIALQSITTGANNIAVGPAALNKVSTGNNNSAVGLSALRETTIGSNNLAFGSDALRFNINGSNNTGIGANSLRSNTNGSFNLALGSDALKNNTTGARNVAIGSETLFNNSDGQNNLAIGNNSLYSNTSGNFNVAIGLNSMNLRTSGDNNVAIGSYSLRNNLGGIGNIAIGNRAGENETGSNKLYIANSATTTPLIYGDFSAKYVTIGDVSPALRTQGVATGGYNLLVKGGILTEKVKVAIAQAGTDWADYVFEPSYQLMSLEEVETFTKENKHLPNVPSAEEMGENGLDVAQTSKMFMEKIEELTLYLIELNKEVKTLKAENERLKSALNK